MQFALALPRAARLLLIAALASWLAAQPPSPPPGTTPLPNPLPEALRELAERVDAAHLPGGKPKPVTGVTGSLELHVLDPKAPQGGQVDVQFRYLEWVRDDQRIRHLLRYTVRSGETPIESGRDRKGYWHLFQGKARDLTTADAEDRSACDRNTNLIRQLLRFLQPGDVLRSLQRAGEIATMPLQLGREPAVECQVIRGELPAFPLLQRGGEDAPVAAIVYVQKATNRLYAIEVMPLLDGKADPARAEFVRLGELREQDGFLVPRQLLHLQRGEDGRMRPLSRAILTTLALRPKLSVDDLDRPAN